MADRAGEAVKSDNDQGFTGGDVVQQAGKHGGARSTPDACSSITVAQLAARSSSYCGSIPCFSVENPGIADQAACYDGFPAVGLCQWATR
jgi:hypothetical protein